MIQLSIDRDRSIGKRDFSGEAGGNAEDEHGKGNIIGIWTERACLHSSSDPDFDPQTVKVGDSMPSPMHFASHDADLNRLEEKFLGLRLRHLPVKKGKFVGMVSIGDVLHANLSEKDSKIYEFNSMAIWQYYENRVWGRK